ncbi:MAG: DUF3800 domain-containing protein [Chloroflexota bacterium]|nr:DUF3800 domain-containing protein [Chloroflexota bacterium]
MRYGYLDESGTVAPFRDSERFLAVAVVVADLATARRLELHAKRLWRKLDRKAKDALGGELKATHTPPRYRVGLLQAIAGEDIAIVAVVVDKARTRRPPDDREDWYREATSLAAYECAWRWPDLRLTVDKRYTTAHLRSVLNGAISRRLADVPGASVTVAQVESHTVRGLQVADFVAWAIGRRYEVDDRKCYDIIRNRIVCEETI